MLLDKNFKEFLRLLEEEGVEYLVIGGYAVGLYGFPRYTGDIDFFVGVSPSNARCLYNVFRRFGFVHLEEEEFLESGMVFRIGNPPKRIEVMNEISGVRFDTAWKNRKRVELEGQWLNLISKSDLMRNKRSTGRSKDQIDYTELK